MTKEHKLYLERLRRSGKTNMFGAAPYLMTKFGMSLHDARKVLAEWMNSYDRDDPDYKEI